MKTITAVILVLTATVSVLAQSSGRSSLIVSNVPARHLFEPGYVTVVNTGTNELKVSFGGNITMTTNDLVSRWDYQFPIQPAASYTTKGFFSVVTVACDTNAALNTTYNIGVE